MAVVNQDPDEDLILLNPNDETDDISIDLNDSDKWELSFESEDSNDNLVIEDENNSWDISFDISKDSESESDIDLDIDKKSDDELASFSLDDESENKTNIEENTKILEKNSEWEPFSDNSSVDDNINTWTSSDKENLSYISVISSSIDKFNSISDTLSERKISLLEQVNEKQASIKSLQDELKKLKWKIEKLDIEDKDLSDAIKVFELMKKWELSSFVDLHNKSRNHKK